ncbi:MAG: TetR/AcrR family transcriptional regulator [Rhodoglobus sp.]
MRERNARGEGARLRDDLVTAARDLLVIPDDQAPFSLRSVAKAAGVSPAAVYRHFASAEELVEAVISDQNDALREALGTGSLRELGGRYAAWGLANRGSYTLLFESADRLAHRGGPGSPGWDMVESLAIRLTVERSLPDGEGTVLAIRLWAMLHGIVSLRIHKPGLPWPTTVDEEIAAIIGRF